MKERTISFFEVVLMDKGEQKRVKQFDWPKMLASVSTATLSARTWEGDHTFVGNVVTYDEEDHLLLHRVKDASEWLSVLNFDTGEVTELESAAGQGYLDTTALAFMPYGNVVGLMQGAVSSPTHKSLEGWLNGLKLFGKGPSLVVRPLLSKAEVERLQQADGASKIEIRIGSHKIAALNERQGRLASMLKRASADYGDIRVTLTISVPRGKTRDEDRRKLLDDLRDLGEVMPEAAELAKARLVYADAGGQEYGQLVEFVEHHITAKRRVPAVDKEGNSIRLSAAVRTIVDVATEHEDELRLAADVPINGGAADG